MAQGPGIGILVARGQCMLLVEGGFQPLPHTFPSWLTGCPPEQAKGFVGWEAFLFPEQSQSAQEYGLSHIQANAHWPEVSGGPLRPHISGGAAAQCWVAGTRA